MELIQANPDFRRLWLAQTVSQIGSQISYLAVPLVAATILRASPFEMGLLAAAGSFPALAVGLFAGAHADRVRRRPLLISSDLFRALLIALIPIAWLTDSLSMALLYGVVVITGVCALMFDIAWGAYLPTLLPRKDLVAGNSSLELSRSTAEVIGPPIGGLLIQVVKAPLALAVDAATFLVSAALIGRIRTPEPARLQGDDDSLLADIREGLATVWRIPEIRALAWTACSIGLFNAMIEAVFILYLVRDVGMPAGLLGVVFAVGSAGFIIGALLTGRVTARFGIGPALALAIAAIGISDLALPLAGSDLAVVAIAVAIGQFGFGLGITLFNVAQVSLRQELVPDHLLGRVGGVIKVAALALVPIGALAGGLCGELIGLRTTLILGALLEAASAIWVWRSSLWRIRTTGSAPAVS